MKREPNFDDDHMKERACKSTIVEDEDQCFRGRFQFARIKNRRHRIYWAANIRRLRGKATHGTSQNEGEHGLPPARVLLPKLLFIVLMFLDSPKHHLPNSETGEHEC